MPLKFVSLSLFSVSEIWIYENAREMKEKGTPPRDSIDRYKKENNFRASFVFYLYREYVLIQ